jgi:endo-1,4-beta-xylanase
MSQSLAIAAQTLKQLGAACGMKVGFAATYPGIQFAGAELAEFFTANFNLLTPMSELSWGVVHPAQNTFEYAGADWLLEFAQQNGMALRGHSLCWNAGNPSWLGEILNSANAESILVGHIAAVAGRYAGKIDSWDVVNEPISVWNNEPDGLSSGPWLSMLGPEYIDIAFRAAAAADPLALRVMNLHECENASEETTRQATLTLLEALLKRGVPVQAVGIESHIDCGVAINQAQLQQFIQAVRGLGLEVLITEFDVNDAKVTGGLPNRDGIVADWYRNYLDMVLPVGGVNRVVFWSPTDNSWMDAMCEAKDPEFVRANGQCDHRPGLINSSMQLKPAYSGVVTALQRNCKAHYVAAGRKTEWHPA